MIKDIREITECPDCASSELVYNENRQQVVCKECGLIYEELTPKEEERYIRLSAPSQRKSRPNKSNKHKKR